MTHISITEMKRIQHARGLHWFTRGSMKFFNTTLETPAIENHFITSEYMDNPSDRRYSIRKFDPETAQISTVGDFQQYKTKREAKQALKEILT